MLSNIKHIAILIAMQAEAQPLIEQLNLTEDNADFASPYPLKVFTGEHQGKKLSIVLNGTDARFNVDNIGTQAAALTAFLTLKHLEPDVLISAGTAGAFDAKGAKIGDIYFSKNIKFHDRRIAIPGFKEYGVGNYDGPNVEHLASEINAKVGIVSTGNSLDMPDTDREMIHLNEADVKEMEAASIAWAAEMFGKPMFAIKSVTDLVDVPVSTEEQFLENLSMASKALQRAVMLTLEKLASN